MSCCNQEEADVLQLLLLIKGLEVLADSPNVQKHSRLWAGQS